MTKKERIMKYKYQRTINMLDDVIKQTNEFIDDGHPHYLLQDSIWGAQDLSKILTKTIKMLKKGNK